MSSSHAIIAYYYLTNIADPHAEVAKHKAFFAKRDIKARIYISEEGINCQMSATTDEAENYIAWMQARPEFKDIFYKIDPYHEHVFPKQTVKYRKQLVAFDTKVDYSKAGKHLQPHEWEEMLTQEACVVIDVRNDYEWQIGHFNGAECPPCKRSKDFIDYAKELKTRIDPQKTPVMMYCTGGIRCETFSTLLKEDGFKHVYQLHGGVINYGHKQGDKHWQGKLFVFDDRMAVPLADKVKSIVGRCHHCQEPNDTYYNCANMDCNHLFLCCASCLERFAGCCQEDCRNKPKVRPYHHQSAHKPFRKWYHYWKEKNMAHQLEQQKSS